MNCSSRGRRRRAFTLIELLTVIFVMAGLAALVYPHFVGATTRAEENVHREQLARLRRQIQLYRVQHGGALPNLIDSWDPLVRPSIYNGKTVGPYLQEVPLNHKRSNVIDGTAVTIPAAPCGFVYDYRGGAGTGMLWATNGSGKKLRTW